MRAWLKRLLNGVCIQSIREHALAEFEGVLISDYRKAGEVFRSDVVEALRLINVYDARRFRRVLRNTPFVVNHVIRDGAPASYHPGWTACVLDYEQLRGIEPAEFRRGCVAALIVHEATHGVIDRHGIAYQGEERLRIERVCMNEQNRFASRLVAVAPNLYGGLLLEFRESDWTSRWSERSLVGLRSYVERYLRQ